MSITARQLSKTGARGKDIDTIIRDQLQIIDEKLLHAERTWGRNVVSYDLPTNLALPGLEKRDAQRVVYSSIIRSLQRREFEVRLLLNTTQTVLYVAWVTELNVEEIEAMNRLIHDARITPADLSVFLHRGTSAAQRGPPGDSKRQVVGGGRRPAPAPAPAVSLPAWAAGGGLVPAPAPRTAVTGASQPAVDAGSRDSPPAGGQV
jgi:hypothetical protein